MLILTVTASGQSFEGLLQTKRSVVNLTTTVTQPGVLEPVAKLRVQRLYVERQKRGVFRVALLPRLVFEGATFDFQKPSAVSLCMRQIADATAAATRGRTVEFRGLKLELGGTGAWTIEAGSAEPSGASLWVLHRPVWRKDGMVLFAAAEAHLVAGSDGQLLIRDPSRLRPDLELSPSATGALTKDLSHNTKSP